jgi:hypothetical protein
MCILRTRENNAQIHNELLPVNTPGNTPETPQDRRERHLPVRKTRLPKPETPPPNPSFSTKCVIRSACATTAYALKHNMSTGSRGIFSFGGACSYPWVKSRLQEAARVPKAKARGAHRKRRGAFAVAGIED